MWQRILVPTDFSTHADRATVLAGELARRFDATLILLHVVDLPDGFDASGLIAGGPDQPPRPAIEVAMAVAQEQLDELAEPLRLARVEVDTLVSPGEPVEEILAAVAVERVDVIVMGTQGHGGLVHQVIGGVTERIVNRAPVPVTTLRAR